ncbi:MAG TPA: DNA mismatch repair protein MutS [Longimicrobiales bacterium]|nr:DNA mismatch repair protein MutS [Longimicrobiales bacterium]
MAGTDTPLMQQWREAKARHPDALVFFRVGDFYEMFYEDAEEGARLLGLTLTSRNNGAAAAVPLAGVPVRARDEYLERLVRLGRRVAVCEQMEEASEAKGLVRREVVETITPGAVLSDALLSDRRNNFLVALWAANGPGAGAGAGSGWAIAAVDASTGEVVVIPDAGEGIEAELAKLEPAELLVPASWEGRALPIEGASVTHRPDWLFDLSHAQGEVLRRYHVHSPVGFGFESADAAGLCALGALLTYLAEVQPVALRSLRPPRIERPGESMALDEMTRRNLELTEPLRPDLTGPDARPSTLLGVIDETVTPMGARLLRRWLLAPLVVPEPIWRRQEAVAELVDGAPTRRALRAELKPIRDLERLAGKVAAGRVTPREVGALRASLAQLPALRDALTEAASPLLAALRDALDPLDDVRARIERALADEPPATLGDGGAIRQGWDAELDELRGMRDGAVDFIAGLQTRERERTGIPSLKVGFNRVFGYYLEVTRAHSAKVPDDYVRKQTLANGERYFTPELKQWEEKVLGAEERIATREAALFAELRQSIALEVGRIQASADRVAQLDVLVGLAELAERRGYVCPDVHTGYALDIRGGRHPVVETMMQREDFIPNDVVLAEDARVMILTGPNMAGKSTLLRQVGLIQLLAQVGSFVPATRAKLPVADRIFTRVGASDNLVRGQSTFMVEMNETASILHGATQQSLVLLDEIGRGTATFDGVSIAWAVTEHLHERVRAKVVFATHYHELTQLADQLDAVVNFNVSIRESGDDIVFLRRLEPGGADRSYGIEVGRLAGLPRDVVARAREILAELEGAHTAGGRGLGRVGARRPAAAATDQLMLFPAADSALVRRLRELDPNRITPLEAIALLASLRAEAVGDSPSASERNPVDGASGETR